MLHGEFQGRTKGMAMQYSQEFNLENWKTIFTNIMAMGWFKALIAGISIASEWMFGAHQEALIVVFVLVILDSITGLAKAIKAQDVRSCGFFRFASKLMIYLIMMGTAGLVDKVLPIKLGATIVYSFLAVTEALSIMENISILGFPVHPRS